MLESVQLFMTDNELLVNPPKAKFLLLVTLSQLAKLNYLFCFLLENLIFNYMSLRETLMLSYKPIYHLTRASLL